MSKYVILEIANTHGGNLDLLNRTINAVKSIDYKKIGIKFQPFKPDTIATPDYKWYEVYKQLFFSEFDWKKIINASSSICDVWIDIFDIYSISILKRNLKNISGIKLQSSITENLEVLNSLKQINTSSLKIMINISGLEISEIENCVNNSLWKGFSKTIIQIGFQDYPTDIENTALQKISVLKALFPKLKFCLADHSDASNELAIQIPIWGALLGCDYLEKHFCISRAESKYDYFSSLEPNEIKKLLENLNLYQRATNGPFINTKEKKYLDGTIQIPILKHNLKKGTLLSNNDFIFRRTAQDGMRKNEINNIQNSFQILQCDVNKGKTIKKTFFKKAKIGGIIACRMKSKRLERKALLPINGVASVERCIMSCLEMKHVDQLILATSLEQEDSILINHLVSEKVRFFQGNAEDVIKRYLDICYECDIDIVIRITADCPVISSEICEILLKEHFNNGSDYTAARECAVGSSVEIYNVEALQRVIDNLGGAPHSEYMTWYLRNNSDFFKINLVDLPKEYIRNYRLTLDQEEDLKMFNELFKKLEENKETSNITNVFKILDNNPSLASINSKVELAYKDNDELISFLNKETRFKK